VGVSRDHVIRAGGLSQRDQVIVVRIWSKTWLDHGIGLPLTDARHESNIAASLSEVEITPELGPHEHFFKLGQQSRTGDHPAALFEHGLEYLPAQPTRGDCGRNQDTGIEDDTQDYALRPCTASRVQLAVGEAQCLVVG
jgi:hypothetical protein